MCIRDRIQAYLDKYTGETVCSKQLYKEALNHTFDEPKQWEIREINEIMNQCISGWRYFPNPRMFSEYGTISSTILYPAIFYKFFYAVF